jgi:CRP-like cAMP-binding protein
MLDRLQVLEQSAFFADVEAEHRLALAGLAREERVPAGSHLFREGDPADAFLVLAAGQVDLSLPIISAGADQPGQAPAAPPAPAGGGGRAGVTLRTVAAPGAPVGWSAVVEPYRHGVTAIARTDTTLLAWDREALHSYARRHPQFGLLFMRQVLTLAGDRLRAARLRLVASRYDAEVLAIQALLDQHGEQLPVTSPLHKIPHYLQNRLTFGDALAVVELLQSSDDRGERELADLVAETLEGCGASCGSTSGSSPSTSWSPGRRTTSTRWPCASRAAAGSSSCSTTCPTSSPARSTCRRRPVRSS